MSKPLLVIFTGVPGSGKTYFAQRLADKIGAVRLNSDAMRLAIFGSLENIEKTYHSPRKDELNSHISGAMDYATKQIITQGSSVIYEAIQRTQADRRSMEVLATQVGARLVLVSMLIDDDKAARRIMQREERDDVRQFDDAKAREVVRHFRDNTEDFERTDYVIEIDGDAPFDAQFAVLQDHLNT